MGWGSASEIFDPVAQALIDLGADEQTKRAVLGPLIDKLRDGDWDTYDESIDEFRDDPAIVAEFHRRGCGPELWDPDSAGGDLDYDSRRDLWVLRCDDCGLLGDGDGSSAEAHDSLVRTWVAHLAAEHGGSGEVESRMLIITPGGTS